MALECDQGAAVVEPRHDLREALALLAEQAFRRNEDVVEEDGAARDDLGAEIVETGPGHARLIEVDQEAADAAGARARLAGPREHQRDIGVLGKAHRGLLAAQDVAVAGAARADDEIGCVRAAAGFGQANGDDRFAGGDFRHPFPGEIRIGELRDDAAEEAGDELDIAHGEITVGDLVDDDAGGDAVAAEAAKFRREFDADQAKRTHLLDEIAIEGRPCDRPPGIAAAVSSRAKRRAVSCMASCSSVSSMVIVSYLSFRAASAVHRQPARDADGLAGDVGGVVAGEEGNDAGIVIRLAEAPHRYGTLQAFSDFQLRLHRRRTGRTAACRSDRGRRC